MNFLNFLKGTNGLRQIDVSEDEDFIDLQLVIVRYWKDEDHNHTIQAKGLWGKQTVGIEIGIRHDMKLGIVNTEVDRKRFYKEGIWFRSIGELSDNFTKALSTMFKAESTDSRMCSSVASLAFILSGHPEYFEEDYIKTKVFFDEANEKQQYAEWYINIDLKNKILELREKAPQYRKNIIDILTNA